MIEGSVFGERNRNSVYPRNHWLPLKPGKYTPIYFMDYINAILIRDSTGVVCDWEWEVTSLPKMKNSRSIKWTYNKQSTYSCIKSKYMVPLGVLKLLTPDWLELEMKSIVR